MSWRVVASQSTRGNFKISMASFTSRSSQRGMIVRNPVPSVTARDFHATRTRLLFGRQSHGAHVRPPRTGKYVKRPNVIRPPVDAPYVPPTPKKSRVSDRTIEIFEGMTTVELSKRTSESISALQDILVSLGERVTSEFDSLSIDVAEIVAMEAGVNVRRRHSVEGTEKLPRPAVVTVMGHVDHGKTSLLDALRRTSTAAKEAGGITQHLGAFVVGMPSGSSVTFLDTPGHLAFSAMRARGAAVTDIVVLVVAADDGVMPQTLEAIAHAKAAGVPIVVAVNKCDKPSAEPGKVRIQLESHGLHLEEMGGEVQVVDVSAVTGVGLVALEEALLLQAEMMDLTASPGGPAHAYVVEARLDRGRGPLATVIVRSGTLVRGQHVVSGNEWGRVRAVRDTNGRALDCATPAMPAELEGLRGVPMAGDDVVGVGSEKRARMLAAGRKRKAERERLRNRNVPEGEERSSTEVAFIVKADVQGTVQAVTDALRTLDSPQVSVGVVHVGVGPVSQSDVDLARACGACIVAFNVGAPGPVSAAAERAGVPIKTHEVIYHLLEDVGNLIVERAPGTVETRVAGQAHVLAVFEMKKAKAKEDSVKIAGCRVVDGHITRASSVRLLRSGVVVFEGLCRSLKREKQDVDRVGKGNECGIVLCDCNELRVGDVLHCIEEVRRKPVFVASKLGAVHIQC